MPELRGYGQVGRTPNPGRCAIQSRITLTVDQATNDMRKPATVPPPPSRVSLIVVARACKRGVLIRTSSRRPSRGAVRGAWG